MQLFVHFMHQRMILCVLNGLVHEFHANVAKNYSPAIEVYSSVQLHQISKYRALSALAAPKSCSPNESGPPKEEKTLGQS